jgi:hypothetical protein
MTQEIKEIDSYMAVALDDLLRHIRSTYTDKYEESMPYVNNEWLKYGSGDIPIGHNVGQAVNYLKRYMSTGFRKSRNPDDLRKAAHFILFELARRLNEN